MSQGGVPGYGPNQDNLKASDADRERIVEQLRRHAAEGRLTMDEFEERMSAAYEARTYGALAELTRDLPVELGSSRAGQSGTGQSWNARSTAWIESGWSQRTRPAAHQNDPLARHVKTAH